MVSVRVPYVHRTDIREGHHEHLPGGVVNNTVDYRGDSSGIGDVTLLGQWRFFNNQATRTEAAFLFGVKAPTGATNRIDALGELFETEFQPGSGSWDVLLGAAFTQRFGAWSFDANVLGVLAGTRHAGHQSRRPLPLQRRGLLPSGRLCAALGAARRVAGIRDGAWAGAASPCASARQDSGARRNGPSMSMLELNGEWHDYENTAGVKDLNSGGHVLLLSPGLRIARGAFSGFATFGIPIVNQMNGLQSKTELSRLHRHRLRVLTEAAMIVKTLVLAAAALRRRNRRAGALAQGQEPRDRAPVVHRDERHRKSGFGLHDDQEQRAA